MRPSRLFIHSLLTFVLVWTFHPLVLGSSPGSLTGSWGHVRHRFSPLGCAAILGRAWRFPGTGPV